MRIYLISDPNDLLTLILPVCMPYQTPIWCEAKYMSTPCKAETCLHAIPGFSVYLHNNLSPNRPDTPPTFNRDNDISPNRRDTPPTFNRDNDLSPNRPDTPPTFNRDNDLSLLSACLVASRTAEDAGIRGQGRGEEQRAVSQDGVSGTCMGPGNSRVWTRVAQQQGMDQGCSTAWYGPGLLNSMVWTRVAQQHGMDQGCSTAWYGPGLLNSRVWTRVAQQHGMDQGCSTAWYGPGLLNSRVWSLNSRVWAQYKE